MNSELRALLVRDSLGGQPFPDFDSQAELDAWMDEVVAERLLEFRREDWLEEQQGRWWA